MLILFLIFAILASYPFIHFIIIHRKIRFSFLFKKNRFKDFMTNWIAFWALLAAFIGIIQVHRQITSQQDQFDKQLQLQRFSSGVELLGSSNESSRIGGIYYLYLLAKEDVKYIEPVCETLCAHIRTITSDEEYKNKFKNKPSNEIKTILDFLFFKDYENDDDKSIFEDCKKNLSNVKFDIVSFEDYSFIDASLKNVEFIVANFGYSFSVRCSLDSVNFLLVKFNGPINLSGCSFIDVL